MNECDVILPETALARMMVETEIERLDGDGLRVTMKELVERYGEHSVLSVDTYYDYSATYVEVRVVGLREETDEEYEARLAKLRKRKLAAQKAAQKRKEKAVQKRDLDRERDEAEFERLKRKLGK